MMFQLGLGSFQGQNTWGFAPIGLLRGVSDRQVWRGWLRTGRTLAFKVALPQKPPATCHPEGSEGSKIVGSRPPTGALHPRI